MLFDVLENAATLRGGRYLKEVIQISKQKTWKFTLQLHDPHVHTMKMRGSSYPIIASTTDDCTKMTL